MRAAFPAYAPVQLVDTTIVDTKVITGRKGNTWESLNLNQRNYAPLVVASRKFGYRVTHVMAREKGLMDFPVANAVDTGECTKSVPRVAARAMFLLNR